MKLLKPALIAILSATCCLASAGQKIVGIWSPGGYEPYFHFYPDHSVLMFQTVRGQENVCSKGYWIDSGDGGIFIRWYGHNHYAVGPFIDEKIDETAYLSFNGENLRLYGGPSSYDNELIKITDEYRFIPREDMDRLDLEQYYEVEKLAIAEKARRKMLSDLRHKQCPPVSFSQVPLEKALETLTELYAEHYPDQTAVRFQLEETGDSPLVTLSTEGRYLTLTTMLDVVAALTGYHYYVVDGGIVFRPD